MRNKLVGIAAGVLLCLFVVSLTSAQSLWDTKKARTSTMDYEDLFAVSPAVGWAITTNTNEIYKTTDGFRTFTLQTNPTTKGLGGLYFVNADTGFIFGDQALCLRTSDGGNNWSIITLPVPDSLNTYSCFFLNDTLGWLSLNASDRHSCVIKTTDAGLTWNYLGVVDTTKADVRGYGWTGKTYMVFWDENNGALGCGTGTTAIYAYYTTDGGASWVAGVITATTNEKFRPNINGFGNALSRTGTNDARMFTLRGALLKTTNRGANWISDGRWWNPYSTPIALWDTWFVNDSMQYYAMKGTTNYGSNQIGRTYQGWNNYDSTQYVFTDMGANAQRITFADENTGFALVEDNFIIKTTDAGNTWAPVDPNAWPSYDFDRVVNYGSGHFMMISDYSTPAHSTDYGETWTVPTAPAWPVLTGDANDIDYRNGVTLGAVGYGYNLRSTDDGYNWTKSVIPVTATPFYSVAFADNNVAVTGGSSGKMCRSTDAGATWAALTAIAPAGSIYKILFKDASNGYLIGSGGIVYNTTNGGAAWAVKDTIKASTFYDMAFTDANTGYAVGYRGYLGKTIDGGTTWNLIDSLGYDYGTSAYGPTCYSMLFKDNLEGWIGADLGIIYHTYDGGLTWTKEPAITTPLGDNPLTKDLSYYTGSCRLAGSGTKGFLGKYKSNPPTVSKEYSNTLMIPVNVSCTLSFKVTANDADKHDVLDMAMTGKGSLVYAPGESPDTGTYTWAPVKADSVPTSNNVNFRATDCWNSSGEINQTINVFVHGDANHDQKVTVSDVVFMINYLFKGGPGPWLRMAADANGDTPDAGCSLPTVTVSDVVYLVNYLFKGGPEPRINTNCLPLLM